MPAGTDTYELTTPKDGSKELVIAFASGYVLENGTREVVITYGAKINEQAKVQGLNFDGNANDVTLTYTNGPGSTEDAKTKAYVYTFGIGASLSGKTDIVGNKVTHEIVKVGEDFVSKDTYEEWVEEGKPGALAGAEFTLTKVKDRDGNAVTDAVPMTAETGEGGILTFTGLSEGEYTLVETKAPEGMIPIPGIVAAHIPIQTIIARVLKHSGNNHPFFQVTAHFFKFLPGKCSHAKILHKAFAAVAHNDRKILPAGFFDFLDDLHCKAYSVFQASPILVCPMVAAFHGKLINQISLVHCMDLHPVKACCL